MCHVTSHIDGYGICVDDLVDSSLECINNLLALAPRYAATLPPLHSFYPPASTLKEWSQHIKRCKTLGKILDEVIRENERISFTLCEDESHHIYLLYKPAYPWHLTEYDKSLTEDDIAYILSSYISYLTKFNVPIEYYSFDTATE